MKPFSPIVRRLLLVLIGLLFAAFLALAILGICNVFTFATSAMAAIGALTLIALVAAILQLPINRALAKRDFILAAMLAVCVIVLLILKLTYVIF